MKEIRSGARVPGTPLDLPMVRHNETSGVFNKLEVGNIGIAFLAKNPTTNQLLPMGYKDH